MDITYSHLKCTYQTYTLKCKTQLGVMLLC